MAANNGNTTLGPVAQLQLTLLGLGCKETKFDRLDSKQERKVRATHTMWNGVLFQPKSPLKCQVMGEAPGSFQLMFPFPVGSRREIISNFSKHAAKHK